MISEQESPDRQESFPGSLLEEEFHALSADRERSSVIAREQYCPLCGKNTLFLNDKCDECWKERFKEKEAEKAAEKTDSLLL